MICGGMIGNMVGDETVPMDFLAGNVKLVK